MYFAYFYVESGPNVEQLRLEEYVSNISQDNSLHALKRVKKNYISLMKSTVLYTRSRYSAAVALRLILSENRMGFFKHK